VANFFGVTAGRLTLNVGFSVAAMSLLDPEIAAAMAGQFFQGSDDAARLIVAAPAAEVAGAKAVAEEFREAAEAESRESQEDLYLDRLGPQAAHDRALPVKQAWKRFLALTTDARVLLIRHLVVSTAAGEMQVRLAGVIAAGGGDPASVVGLCSGLGEVESSLPAIALYDLAQVAKKAPATRKALAAGDSEAIVAAMSSPQAAWSAFTDAFDDFIHRYGFRVQGEADPMNADWGDDPTFVISQVRSMMNVAAKDSPRAQIKRAMAGRQKLEKAVRAGLTPELRPVFDAALVQAQRFTRMRELTKAVWVLGTRRQRPPLLAVADGLVAAGRLRHSDDMAFCTYAEVEAMVKGKAVDDLAASITARKKQWRQAHDYTLPDAFVGTAVPKRKPKVADVRTLTGIGVSVGVATGVARVIMNTEAAFAREIEPGEILVAPFTDTPWTPLFIPAGAVVVETGGVLSHAATVAREFGIPCVVLVADATRVIRDGDTVKVDGAAGTVHIVKYAK
jgi:pyruvate,water dikinase